MVQRNHAIFLPFPAFGHIIPMLELAKKVSVFHDVTFIVSTIKVSEIRAKGLLTQAEEKSIRLLALADGLTAEEEKDVSAKQLTTNLMNAAVVLESIFKHMPIRKPGEMKPSELIMDPVDYVVADFVMSPSMITCHERRIPFHIFHTASAMGLYGKLCITKDTPAYPDDHFLNPGENNTAVGPTGIPESLKTLILRFQEFVRLSDSVLLNSVQELELDALELLQNHPITLGKSLRFVGPLKAVEKNQSATKVKDWLNGKRDRSVIYISFGSLTTHIPPDQVKQIAEALLSSGENFIWSLKQDEQSTLPAEILDKVADQFNGCSGRFLILLWAPQKMILTHPSVRLFVTHCGWNSTLECLSAGVPVVAWPMFADQHGNSELIVRLSVGIKIPKTSLLFERIVSTEEFGKALKTVQDRNFLKAAKHWSKVMEAAEAPNGSSAKCLLDLIRRHSTSTESTIIEGGSIQTTQRVFQAG